MKRALTLGVNHILKVRVVEAGVNCNAQGQRNVQIKYDPVSGALVSGSVYLYGLTGELIGQADYNSTGQRTLTRYWIWLNGMPLAQVELTYTHGSHSGGQLIYLHPDHLNTPRLASTDQGVVWSWVSDAYGDAAPNEDVDGDGIATHIPLRFPGQFYDAQTQLNYNYFRDYDAKLGRYVQSDPIGLQGGLNTYGYAEGNSLSSADPFGLASCTFTLSTGRIVCSPSKPQSSPVDIPAASGNNGGGLLCRNNPNCASMPNRGPIPLGCWRWTNGTTGKPNGRVLEPCPRTDTNVVENRTLIRSHSCANPFGPGVGPQFCSEGCVTGTVSGIQALNLLIDSEPGSTLQVVP